MDENNGVILPPDLKEARKNVLVTEDDLKYGLRAVVRILSRKRGKRGYFIEEFEVKFASELQEEIHYEKTLIDHENLKIIIKLPDPPSNESKEVIRHSVIKDYTLGIDDLKTRAGLIAYEGFDEKAKKLLIDREKMLEEGENK